MTKPKRYEGEALRAEQWHNMSRDKAWEIKRAGMRTLDVIIAKKFCIWCETKYDPVDCGYLIVTEITSNNADQLVMVHEEPCLEFPSDHLKTKLILLAG